MTYTANEIKAALLEVSAQGWRGRRSKAARDADASDGWGGKIYADYLEQSALDHCAYFVAKGDLESAQRMLTQSISESVAGNDGE